MCLKEKCLEGWLAQWCGSVDARGGFSRAGSILATIKMPVICPTCQIYLTRRARGAAPFLSKLRRFEYANGKMSLEH
jgi:hypothetical protein